MSQGRALKKDQAPLIVYNRLYDVNKARMLKVCKATGLDHNAIGLAGTLAEIARLEAAAAPVTPKEAKQIETFKKVTGSTDICSVLAAAMRDHTQRAAAALPPASKQPNAA